MKDGIAKGTYTFKDPGVYKVVLKVTNDIGEINWADTQNDTEAYVVVYDPTRENALTYEHVNETVMKEFTVIPMSFGTVFRTPGDVVEFLKDTSDALRDVLEKMKDKIEFGLKVLPPSVVNWNLAEPKVRTTPYSVGVRVSSVSTMRGRSPRTST